MPDFFVDVVCMVIISLTDLFSLIPGRYPQAVSLPDFLAKLPSLPGGPEAIQIMVELIQNKTGMTLMIARRWNTAYNQIHCRC